MVTDDKSVATVVAGKLPEPFDDPFIEKCIKFTFCVSNDDEASQVANGHFLALKSIFDAFPDEVRIFNNQNKRLTSFKLSSHAVYLRHFKMHHRRENARRKRKATYTVYHRIQSTVTLTTIRRQQQVCAILDEYKGNLGFHAWPEDVMDVVSLGFFTEVDPSSYLSDDFALQVSNEIISGNGKRGGIPKFKVTMCSPSATVNQHRLRTKAYDLQVDRKDAKLMSTLLQSAYADSPCFIFYRMRYVHEKAFNNAIRAQNNFLNHNMIVPLIGVPANCMFYMEEHIQALPGVIRVLRHRRSVSEGRFNIQTDEPNFKAVAQKLTANLHAWINDSLASVDHDVPDPLHFPEARVMLTLDDNSDNDSISSYFSSCSDAFSLFDASTESHETDFPPPESKPATQAWGKPRTQRMILSEVATNTFTAVSDITPTRVDPDVQGLREANATLSAELAASKTSQEALQLQICALREQFTLLQATLPPAAAPPAPPMAPAPSLPPDFANTLKALISQVLQESNLVPGSITVPTNPTTPERENRKSKRLDQKSTPTHSSRDTEMTQATGPSAEEMAATDNEL
jgi:hypothetical protein